MSAHAHLAALRPTPHISGVGVSSMAHMFFGTFTGVSCIAEDISSVDLDADHIYQKLEGMKTILQPQVDIMEKIILHVRSMQNFGTADYIDPDGEIEDTCSECLVRLQAFLEKMERGDEKLNSTLGNNSLRRGELHETYGCIIALTQQAIELIQTLAGAIVTHDINAEPSPGRTWERLDDMLSDLKALPV